jgi:uncharacterized membrane protein
MLRIRINKKHYPYLILFAFGILLFAMGILNHYFFRSYTFDYGNYNFAFWDYAHFRISPMPTYPGNFLQDHFSLTLMYFVPVYWLINWITGTYTLIIIQYTLILVAAWYSFKLIQLKSENIWLGTGVLIYYFTLLGRYTTISCDVNIAVISACFIPIFIYYFETKKYFISSIILVLSLLSRENIPIWFVFIFIVLLIDHHKDKKAVIFSLAGISISVIYFVILFKILIPSIETSEKKFTLFNYAALGENPGEAISFVIHHPFETIKLFFINHLNDPAANGVKAEFYWVYLISGGFVLFLRPKYLIWFIPIVAQKMLNDNSFRWGIATYYSIEVVTLLPLSVFMTISSIKSELIQKRLVVAVCLATIGMTIHKLDASNRQIPWTMASDKEKIYDKRFYTPPFDVKKVNSLLSMIPPNAKVSASDHILAHLAQRQSIYLFPTVNDAEYIVFSVYDDYFMISHDENEASRNKYLSDPNWEVAAKEFPVFLLRLKESNNQEKTENRRLTLNSDSLFCSYENFDDSKNNVLFDNGETADATNSLSTEKFHSEKHSIKLTAKNPYSRVFKIDSIENIISIQIKVWCYCDEELKANIIADCGKDYTFYSNKSDTIEPSGWKRLTLTFWVPQERNVKYCHISVWYSGTQSAYFDDLQIIKNFKD